MATHWKRLKEGCETAINCGFVRPNSHSKDSNFKSDHQKRKSTGNHTADTQAKKTKSPNTDMCTACGRLGHKSTDCQLTRFHPNVNPDPSVTFANSKEGKQCFRKFGKYTLPFGQDVDGNKVDRDPPRDLVGKLVSTGRQSSGFKPGFGQGK